MEIEQYLIWTGALLLLVCCALGIRLLRRRSSGASFLTDTLQKAAQQNSAVDLKLKNDAMRAGLSARIFAVDRRSIHLQTNQQVPDSWADQPVEVFFRIDDQGNPVFFVFDSRISAMQKATDGYRLALSIPAQLRVEKKRFFTRARPPDSDIFMIALWPLAPGKRLPRTNSELGQPAIARKMDQPGDSINIANISAAGIALILRNPVDIPLSKGSQLSGLVVYRGIDSDNKVIFLFTGEIMNSREEGNKTTIGVEFTNWAVQKPGESEIHWTHSSPWRGVKPIHLWVDQIEKSGRSAA